MHIYNINVVQTAKINGLYNSEEYWIAKKQQLTKPEIKC